MANEQQQAQDPAKAPQQQGGQQQGGQQPDELTQIVHSLREVSEHLGKLSATQPTAGVLKRAIDGGLRFFTHV